MFVGLASHDERIIALNNVRRNVKKHFGFDIIDGNSVGVSKARVRVRLPL